MAESAQERLRRRQGTTPTGRLSRLPTPPTAPTQPGPYIAPPTTRPKPRLTAPTLAPVPDVEPKLGSEEEGRRKTEEAFAIAGGGLKANIMSGPGAVGMGIKMLPTFAGKAFQTALGFVELTSPTGQVKLATGDSRLNKDWKEGEELGLEGEALVAYAMHRQLPLAGDYITSATATGRSLGELATFGRYDAGEEGIDYVNAYRQGRLGAKIVEDAGNIILAGRLAGAGNVVARGGQAIAGAGAPRVGGAIATTGRFIEEPIGTAARGAAGLVETSATRAGRTRLAEAAGRIAAADIDRGAQVGPLRQAVDEATRARRQRASRRWNEIQKDIVKLRDEQNVLSRRDPNSPRIAEINLLIEQKERLQERVFVRAGVPKQIREIIKEGQRVAEADRTQFQEKAARYIAQGVEPRSPEALRASAERRQLEAQRLRQEGEPARAVALEELAAKDRMMADLQEQYPGVLNAPVAPEVSPAVHIMMDELVPLVVREYNRGATPQQIADNLTSPAVSPDIEMRGYRYTAADIQYLLDYLNGNLNPAQVLVLQETYALYRAWSEWITTQQMAGRGRKDPLSPVALQTTPDPKKLAEFIGNFGAAGGRLMEFLDESLVLMIEQVAPDVLKQFNIDPEKPSGVFVKFAETPYGSVPFNLANATVIINYDRILSNPDYGHIFRSPDVYPANMRRELEAEDRFLAETRAEAVKTMLDGLRDISTRYEDLLDERTLTSIADRIAKLEDSPLAFDKTQYTRLAKSVSRLAQRVLKRIKGISTALERLSLEEQQIVADLEFGYATLNSLEAYLLNLAEGPPAQSPRLRAAEAKVRDLEDERVVLLQERATLNEQLDAERQEQTPRLQQITDELSTLDQRIKKLTDEQTKLDRQVEAHQRETKIIRDALERAPQFTDPETILPLMEDYNQILEFGESGPPEPVRVTDQQVREAKRKAVEEAAGDVPLANLYADFDSLLGARKLKARARQNPDGSMEEMGLLDEDYIDYVRGILPNTKQRPWFKEFVDEYTAADGEALDAAVEQAAASYFGEIQQLSQTGETGSRTAREFASIEDWLGTLARAYRRIKEAEERVKKAERRPLREYREDLELEQAGVLGEDSGFWRQSKTGLDIDDVRETALIIINGEAQALARIEENARKYDADNAARRSAEITEELRQARTRRDEVRNQPQITYDTAVLRRTGEINRRLTQIERQLGRVVKGRQKLGPARRSLQFARQAEPREAAQAERAQLRGVGRVIRPEPGAEGPRGAQILRGVRTKAERRLERLEGKEAANRLVVQRLRTDQQRLSTLEQETTNLRERAVEEVEARLAEPAGAQLVGMGTRTRYMPGGTTSNVRNARNVATEMRSAGAAPQMKTQLELSRFTGIQPLSFEETALKIGEITNAYNRHVIVEQLLKDPMVTTNPTTLLTSERIEAIREEAAKRVMAQTRTPTQAGLQRPTQYDMDARIKEEFGRMLAEEIDRAGYEPVSRVDVDPETGVHEAVGNLLEKVSPESIDEHTFLMRKGLAQRIVQQFEVIGQRNVPEGVASFAESIGRATGAWKTVVLPFSIRWQVGDLAGNVLNAWMIGDVPPDVLVNRMRETIARLDSDRKLLMDSTDMIADPLIEALQGAGLQSRGVKLSSVAALRSTQANPRTAIDDVRMMFGPLKGLRKTAFKFNEFQNVVARTAFAIEKLDQILRSIGRSIEEITPESQYIDPELGAALQEAVRQTHKALGAFSEMSPWERKVIRQVYPFWAWVKFINKAAVNLAIDNPDRVLFTVALGNMVADPDDSGFFSFLQGQIPVGGYFRDLGFINPYSDAIIFGENPFSRVQETLSGVSPVIRTPMKGLGLTAQYLTGWQTWPFEPVSQPSYLEGRQGRRDLGILAGELAYLALKDWGGPARNILESLPANIPLITTDGRLRGTDVAVGPGPRFGQGSLRTGTGPYAQPRLSPTAQRIGAIMRALGVPGAPLADVDIVREQAIQQQIRDERARFRKEREWWQSRGG